MLINNFNYNIEDKNILLDIAIRGLKYKIDELPMYKSSIENDNDNFEAYVEHMKKEIAVFEEMKFDGYMLLLHNMLNSSREMNIFITCFGSIQYSLVAYVLEITEYYNFRGFREFLNFTAFEKNPSVHVVSSSPRINGVLSYMEAKYSKLIKKLTYNKNISFHDNLTLKFIDLDIDNKVQHSENEKQNLFDDISSLEILEQDILDD